MKWHDGSPFTSADLVFAFAVRKDPEIATRIPGRPDLMRGVSAPDPATFIVHWAAPYVNADRAEGLVPLPRHLLEETFLADKASLLTSSRLTTDFVGLGPYRLDKWERGSHMEFSRFEEYYQGRPPLDRVIVRFLGDPNTMVANILSGAVDILLPEGIGLEAALDVRRRWEGTNNRVQFDLEGGLRIVDSQYRPEVAVPTNGLTNRTVREALYHAIDRASLTDAIVQGMAPVADSWIPPGDARRPELEPSIPQYPYDVGRAQQLLAEAGWVRGADGILGSSGTGERFETQIWADQENEAIREMNIIANFWKAIGVQANINPILPSRLGDREYLASYPGALLSGPPANRLYEDRYHSRSISSVATRWAGTNRFGYSNPRVDALLDQLSMTLSAREQVGVHRQLLQGMLGDLAVMPLYWEVLPVVALAGVKSNKVADNTATWDFIRWDRE